jgi:hypothetical protein
MNNATAIAAVMLVPLLASCSALDILPAEAEGRYSAMSICPGQPAYLVANRDGTGVLAVCGDDGNVETEEVSYHNDNGTFIFHGSVEGRFRLAGDGALDLWLGDSARSFRLYEHPERIAVPVPADTFEDAHREHMELMRMRRIS